MSIESSSGAPSAVSTEAAEQRPPEAGELHPWSPRMTLLLGILLLGGYFLLQGLVMGLALLPELVAGAADGGTADLMGLLQARMGLLFTIATAVAAPLTIASTLAVARWGLTRRGVVEPRVALRRSLGVARPRASQIFVWSAATVALLAVYEVLAGWLDRPPLPDFMAEFHASSGWLPGLLFVVVFVAPLVEEVLFRGFMLPGLAAGPGGAGGAIVVTALLFALVHTQYDLFDMSAVLALGVLLGAARHASGSLWLAYGLHAAINAVAAAQLVWALGW